ncbi:hypothetical protein NEF87_002968 [Candidatus Lokiarchaeum ossiferum]|uniref:Oligoendopeptidase F n=1 Tax=Candidatus Lokiarchaeum ossiferum TaxID=2951803 RepID=A0ABY6HTK1_9ARCH|nr:hypothetical protein NEF87_002968 [Candidatus Lokiarchaeum sp. B-35]
MIKLTTSKNQEEIAWDFSEIFPNIKSPQIDETITALQNEANLLVETYKGKIAGSEFSANRVKELFEKEESFLETLSELVAYASLSFYAEMTSEEVQSLFNRVNAFQTNINKQLAFLSLEVGTLLLMTPDLIKDPLLSNYQHHMERIHRNHAHKLSEVEEQIMLEKDEFGVNKWSELQSKWLNTRMMDVEVEGKIKNLSYAEANGLLSHPDRATRTSANKAIYGLLGKENEIFSSALRNICGDWMNVTKRRHYDSPMHQSLISNDVDQNTIDNLMKAIVSNVGVYQKYLTLKAKIMDLPKLGNQDLVAPLLLGENKKFEWEEATKLVLEAYNGFDPTMAAMVQDMITRNHIDASPRFGKTNGAFCESWYKGKSAFMLQSFTGSMGNIYTLAHELGHACHAYLSSQEQTLHNTNTAMVVAEIASIFGELLMTDLLLEKAETKVEKIKVLAHVLDDAGMATFQVSARFFFEQSLYDSIRQEEFLSGEKISELWCAGRDKIFGNAVDWFDEMNWEWAMKAHYYIPNFRFYNYPYVFANCFVYALYQIYKQEGASFVPKFKKMLSAGSSLSPKKIGEIIGFDISKPEFWELGLQQYARFTEDLEKLL